MCVVGVEYLTSLFCFLRILRLLTPTPVECSPALAPEEVGHTWSVSLLFKDLLDVIFIF